MSQEPSLSIANPHPEGISNLQKLGLAGVAVSLFIFVLALFNAIQSDYGIYLTTAVVLLAGGGVLYGYEQYKGLPEGIKNNGVFHRSLSNRGAIGWVIGVILTTFYVSLYWFPSWIGMGTGIDGANTGLVAIFDPLSQLFKGKPASQWFVYGTFYTLAIVILGVKFLYKYRHNRYQKIRTGVVMLSQLILAYLIPEILEGLNFGGEQYFAKDLKNMWPLQYYFFEDWHINNMVAGGPAGMFYLVWGIFLFAVGTPIITYFVGKRWYCSWVCGCGGLAETAGDSFRQLSSKKMGAWKLERYVIHAVMIFIFVVTAAVLYGYFSNSSSVFGLDIYTYFRKPYGFLIGAAFSGVVGVGFYPMLGNRVWCRFGCPLAGYMGIIQRFKSKFRITTNGGQCISCGNCSTYCEQGIDVRAYAQRGENIVRASCVGCGVCSAVCPRGVLKLENGPEEGRIHGPIEISSKGIQVVE